MLSVVTATPEPNLASSRVCGVRWSITHSGSIVFGRLNCGRSSACVMQTTLFHKGGYCQLFHANRPTLHSVFVSDKFALSDIERVSFET